MIVDTTAGKVQGLHKHGVLQFRGIPYARAERFGPARPTDGWVGIRDATAFGPMAHQNPSPLEAMLGAQDQAGDEDCLVVNVYTPAVDDAARTGSPEHDELPWPAYDTERRATCLLDRDVAVADDPSGEIRRLWDELTPSPSPTY